jgi:catechol 2,3-dioxygenase-like lactoylglutathione lyase family enzyme
VFDHVHLRVADLAESKRFYATVLAPLAFEITTDLPDLVEFGALSLSAEEPQTQAIHLAFLARTRDDVDAFYGSGIDAGFADNGAPGLRDYAPDYYAAYLLDPDGHNVEAVHRDDATRATWTWIHWTP